MDVVADGVAAVAADIPAKFKYRDNLWAFSKIQRLRMDDMQTYICGLGCKLKD